MNSAANSAAFCCSDLLGGAGQRVAVPEHGHARPTQRVQPVVDGVAVAVLGYAGQAGGACELRRCRHDGADVHGLGRLEGQRELGQRGLDAGSLQVLADCVVGDVDRLVGTHLDQAEAVPA